MPTDLETTKKMLMLFTKRLRDMEREMLVQVAVANILKLQLHLNDAQMDQLIETARSFPSIEQQLREKYDNRLEQILAKIDEADLQKQMQHLLEELASKGLPN